VAEYSVSKSARKYRIDLATFCKKGNVAIECDNLKAHSSKFQIVKDRRKDNFLKSFGWKVVRLKEKDIIERLSYCTDRIQKVVASLGGQT
jgi:very-short-patch-repair endonuclease